MTTVTRAKGLFFLAGFALFFSWDIVTGGEHWPFGSFSMFSRVKATPEISRYEVTGVADSSGREFSLDEPRSLSFDFEGRGYVPARRVLSRFSVFDRGAESGPNRRLLLAEFYRHYDRRKGIPRIKALRLYLVSWDLTQWRRLDPRLRAPAKRTRLLEMARADFE